MPTIRQRLKQIFNPDDYNDTLSAAEVSSTESTATNFELSIHGILSQIKRIIHGSYDGNWHDDVETIFDSNVSLKALNPNNIVTSDDEVVVDDDGNVVIGDI